jgi:hypothetical protein
MITQATIGDCCGRQRCRPMLRGTLKLLDSPYSVALTQYRPSWTYVQLASTGVLQRDAPKQKKEESTERAGTKGTLQRENQPDNTDQHHAPCNDHPDTTCTPATSSRNIATTHASTTPACFNSSETAQKCCDCSNRAMCRMEHAL